MANQYPQVQLKFVMDGKNRKASLNEAQLYTLLHYGSVAATIQPFLLHLSAYAETVLVRSVGGFDSRR